MSPQESTWTPCGFVAQCKVLAEALEISHIICPFQPFSKVIRMFSMELFEEIAISDSVHGKNRNRLLVIDSWGLLSRE
jgi:hypothetical protein